MTQMTVDAKLATNKFFVCEQDAHIVIQYKPEYESDLEKLVKACPAGLYRRNDDGSVSFDYAGCLECGTCRVLCHQTLIKKWDYPLGSYGVEYRYG